MGQDKTPFWETKTLDEMNEAEWESLCDGCGRCCLLKIEDWDSGEVFLTRLACRLLDGGTCRCRDYVNRHKIVDDCVSIDPEKVRSLTWLPASCAYRRVEEGRGLSWWHPLVSGSRETVIEAGISVKGWVRCETSVDSDDYHRFIISDFDEGKGR